MRASFKVLGVAIMFRGDEWIASYKFTDNVFKHQRAKTADLHLLIDHCQRCTFKMTYF